jgi:hypothetical protein
MILIIFFSLSYKHQFFFETSININLNRLVWGKMRLIDDMFQLSRLSYSAHISKENKYARLLLRPSGS